jgi:amino acid permease
MITTSLVAITTNSKLDSSGENHANPELFRIDRLGRIFFIVIFASLYENIIPTATSFVKNKARDMPKLINAAISTFNLLYILTGVILAFAIENPQSMSSLNWRNYTAGKDWDDKSWWTYIIAYLVVLLPAFDLASSYPLLAFNFSDNLMSIAYGVEGKKTVTMVREK